MKAAISFAGGRGSDGKEHNCNLDGLLNAFRSFGKDAAKHGAIPMLWIYSQNDHYFPPSMAEQFHQAYLKGEGPNQTIQFLIAPPNGEDGHHLYSHPDAWSEAVEGFLKANNLLPLGDELLPPPGIPNVPPLPGLHDRGLEAWTRFLGGPPYKAFAITGTGGWGLSSGAFDQEIADQEAIERCRKASGPSAGLCKVVARTPGAK